ncbi:MAG: Ig-like domain-containing protein [Mogibacterium sp.]|nr:Ig-like domain-containing protein [Mogibacterium sp.]
MRPAISNNRIIAAAVAIGLLAVALCFVVPQAAFAADNTNLSPRHIWFTYGYTECTGESHPCIEDYIAYYESTESTYPEYYGVTMMACDSDHVVQVMGDGVTADNLTLTSSNPAVLDIDNEGNVTVRKTGKAEITATVAADDKYKECSVHLGVTVDKHDGWVGTSAVHYAGRSPAWGLDLDTADGSQQLVVALRPGAGIRYSSSNPDVAYVDADGLVTPAAPGEALLRFDVDDGGGKYKPGYFVESITVTGEDLRKTQEITGDLGPFTIDWHDGLALDLHAQTALSYSVVSGSKIVRSVNQNGLVSFTGKGTARIKVTAAQSAEYKSAEVYIDITARDYEEEAAQQAAEEEARQKAEAEAARQAALKAEIAKAKSLKRPTFKARALSGRRIKLTWGKVANTDGYILYIKYPGSKKYVKALRKNATVKSVTHKGLSRGRVYRYKVRAYKKVNGKVYYGPFSVVRKARAR